MRQSGGWSGSYVEPLTWTTQLKGRRIPIKAGCKEQAIARGKSFAWWPTVKNKANPINARGFWTFIVEER